MVCGCKGTNVNKQKKLWKCKTSKLAVVTAAQLASSVVVRRRAFDDHPRPLDLPVVIVQTRERCLEYLKFHLILGEKAIERLYLSRTLCFRTHLSGNLEGAQPRRALTWIIRWIARY